MPSEPVIGICAVRERARWSFWNQDAHLVADTYVAPLRRAFDGTEHGVTLDPGSLATDDRWVLGVQWHPEADDRSRMFHALAEAALDYACGLRNARNPGRLE